MLDYSLLGAVAVSVVLLLIFYLRPIMRVTRRVADDAEAPLPEGGYPAVSVIVYTNSDGDNLATLLPMILEQDYPAPLEVIVVNDGDASEIEGVIGNLELRYSNLYMTYAPARSRNLSRKKLSVTLGIKAARYDTVVLTTGNCQPCASTWLRSLCRGFVEGKDIVIGYAVPALAPGSEEKPLSRTASFDIQADAVRYLSYAIAGRPYRGNACNLAYRKEVFRDARGFSTHLNLKFGDDDIFINQVADRSNTAVEISPDAMVYSFEYNPAKAHRFNKLRYDFTARRLHTSAFIATAFCSWLWWIWVGLSVAAIVFGLPSVIPAIAVTLMSLGLCIPVMTAWRSCARSLGSRPLLLTVVWFILIHPFYNLSYRLRGHFNKSRNFTWEL